MTPGLRTATPDLLSRVLDATSYAVMVTAADGTIVHVNRAFTLVTGWSAAEAIGRAPNLIASGRQDVDFYEAMWRALRHSGQWQGEIWNRRKDGEAFLEFLTIDALRDAAGEVTHFVAVFSELGERILRERRLSHLAFHDDLTGLPNRTLFLDRLERAVSLARRKSAQLAVAMLDLDGFQVVNETFGHEAGDLLLEAASQRLKGCLRESDTVSRLGGDEFAVLLPFVEGAKGAMQTAQRLRAALVRPFILAGEEISIGASLGVALMASPTAEARALLAQADRALERVKRDGKGEIAFFEEHGARLYGRVASA